MENDLDIAFNEAFNKISALKKGVVAPDTMLLFYAFYKQANFGNKLALNSGSNVRNAFKFNAWIQLNGMSSEEAKQEYIKLAKTILETKK
ncbi:acyl-CoA-binding protein [Polaribacter sp.]|uniref:acyl-CoA-binding protein n=1 Tax=Polaribacter sp. TaxID=1920175 RepID=UPI003EF7F07D